MIRHLPGGIAAAIILSLPCLLVIGSCSRTESVTANPELAPAPVEALYRPGSNGLLTDGDGREILFRGINVNSLGEYWQFNPERQTVYEFTETDMDVVASLGFNFVRLIVTWSTIEPEPGQYDDGYIDLVNTTIEKLWDRGIYTLVDLHQDAWGPTLPARENEDCPEGTLPANGWDGAPSWATLVDDATPRCSPAPNGERNREMSPAVRKAWTAFLRNDLGPGDIGLQDRYASMLQYLAERVGGTPGVMGYDIINEPNAIRAEEEYRGLENLYQLAVAGLRVGEARAGLAPRVIVFEPSGIWAHLAEGGTVRKFSDDPQLAYGPHIYQGSISGQPLVKRVVERIQSEASSYGGIPVIVGEWGVNLSDNDEKTVAYLDKILRYQDQEHWGMALWQYQTACGDPHVVKTPPEETTAWGLQILDCTSDRELVGWNTDLMQRLGRPALHFAPSLIDSINWDDSERAFFANGSNAQAGNDAVLFIPEHHADLELETTGLDEPEFVEMFGGRKITAAAIGGEWSIRISP